MAYNINDFSCLQIVDEDDRITIYRKYFVFAPACAYALIVCCGICIYKNSFSGIIVVVSIASAFGVLFWRYLKPVERMTKVLSIKKRTRISLGGDNAIVEMRIEDSRRDHWYTLLALKEDDSRLSVLICVNTVDDSIHLGERLASMSNIPFVKEKYTSRREFESSTGLIFDRL